MKGVLKGFKYVSSIFEEEKEDEIQIGLPTDVKHVAHIGMDGPSTESPSWMKEYTAERPKSAPLDSKGQPIDSSSQKTSKDTELTKASRRRHSADSLAFDNSEEVISTKSKGSRKHHKKANADGTANKSSRSRRNHKKHSLSDQEGGSTTQDLNGNRDVSESTSPSSPTSRKLPDIPKKSRRKKVKDEISKMTSKAKALASSDNVNAPPPPPPPPPTTTTTDNTSYPLSDPGSVSTDSTTTIICDSESCRISRKPSPPPVVDEGKSNSVGCFENSD